METWETTFEEIDVDVSCECASNSLEVRVKREKKEVIRYENGKVVVKETSIAEPYPNPYFLVNNIESFEPYKIYTLLCSRFQDIMSCDSMTREIVSQSKLKQAQGPLYISVEVTLTPQTIFGDPNNNNKEPWTCGICLEEEEDLGGMELELDCSHVFHSECISKWLCERNTCPLCRTVIEDSDDDYPY